MQSHTRLLPPLLSQSFSNSAVLNLRAGDRVTLRVTEGQIYEPNGTRTGYTTFTGYRIG